MEFLECISMWLIWNKVLNTLKWLVNTSKHLCAQMDWWKISRNWFLKWSVFVVFWWQWKVLLENMFENRWSHTKTKFFLTYIYSNIVYKQLLIQLISRQSLNLAGERIIWSLISTTHTRILARKKHEVSEFVTLIFTFKILKPYIILSIC